MNEEKLAPIGALILRVALGVMFLVHSLYLKLVVFTLPGTVKFYESLGLPAWGAHAIGRLWLRSSLTHLLHRFQPNQSRWRCMAQRRTLSPLSRRRAIPCRSSSIYASRLTTVC